MEFTTIIKGVEFQVEFDYQPEEPEEIWEGGGYPGCAASIGYVTKIEHKGTDFMEVFENDLEMVKDAIWAEMTKIH